MRKRLTRTLTRFAIAIAIMLGFAGLFSLYTDTLSEEQQGEVLIKAVPFVAVFIAIVLAFICLIVVVAVVLEGKVPQRTYVPVERLIIAGILLGVLGLFQGWKLFAYEHGFLVLLVSVLGFMIWSHLTPMTARESQKRPPLSRQAHIIGIVAAVLVWGLVAINDISDSKPEAPYGFGKTLWDFKDDDEKAAIQDEAEDEYRTAMIPTFVLVSLLPAGVAYFGVRELADAFLTRSRNKVPQPPAAQHANASLE